MSPRKEIPLTASKNSPKYVLEIFVVNFCWFQLSLFVATYINSQCVFHSFGWPGVITQLIEENELAKEMNIIRVDYKKVDPEHPCDPDPCGYNAICHELNGNAFCQCRYAPFIRLPESGCNSECSTKFDCPSDQTCIRSKCVNSCPGGCSANDECFVFQHKAKCRSKNSPPECTSNSDCSSDRACDGYQCVDPCLDHCVEDADCQIVNQQPICTCKPGYFQGPYRNCHREGTIVE